jgi:hypothetical protein
VPQPFRYELCVQDTTLRRVLLRTAIVTLVLSACGRELDPWYAQGGWPTSQSVAQTDIVPVVDQQGAIARLQHVAWSRLEAPEVLRFTGQTQRAAAARPYLLRSVGYSPAGGYNVSYFGTEVLVANGTNGSEDQMYKSPVVVYLDFEPTKLFVTCFADK